MSHREMARALGISKTQVTRDIQTILDDLTVSNREAAERLVTTRLRELTPPTGAARRRGHGRLRANKPVI